MWISFETLESLTSCCFNMSETFFLCCFLNGTLCSLVVFFGLKSSAMKRWSSGADFPGPILFYSILLCMFPLVFLFSSHILNTHMSRSHPFALVPAHPCDTTVHRVCTIMDECRKAEPAMLLSLSQPRWCTLSSAR